MGGPTIYDNRQKRMIYRLMEAIFNGEELTQFGQRFYPAVAARFTPDLENASKIELLIEYCTRRGQLGKLVASIQQAKPGAYQSFVQRVQEPPQQAPAPEAARLALSSEATRSVMPPGLTTADIAKNPEMLLNQALVGRYQIEEILDRGGVGAVFKAYDTKLEIDVAIKLILLDQVEQPAMRERVRQEVRTAIKLDHPGIVKIFDFGETDALLYIIMEYIAGYNLRELRDYFSTVDRRLALPRILELVRQICLTVDYLHQQRVLHPGTKPENIMVKRGSVNEELAWQPVLINLGLLRPHRETLTTQQISIRRLTFSVSPELLLGHQTDLRSDVYALGIILYNLILGQPPFRPQNLVEATHMHVKEPPPSPRSIDPDLPEAVEQIMLKALAKDPAERFLSAKGMAQAIAEYLAGSSLPLTTAPAGVDILTESKPLVVTPGESITTKITLHNEGSQDHHSQIEVEGVPPEWLSVSPSALTLGPGEREEIELTIQPPRAPTSRAGRHVLIIRSVNQQAPEQIDEVKKVLTVAPYVQFDSQLWPEEIAAGQITQIILENQGNSAGTFIVQPKPADNLAIEPDRAPVKLAAGESQTIDFRVSLSRRPWIGDKLKQTFSIDIHPSEGATMTRSGQVTSRGLLTPWWVQASIVLVGVLLCVAVSIYPLIYPSEETVQATADRATADAISRRETRQAAAARAVANATNTVQAGTAQATGTAVAEIQSATQTAAWAINDNDRDGLSNDAERQVGTDPENRDTDNDGLDDGAEVLEFTTNPFNQDTDYDGVSDAEEVRLKLNPLDRDTDVDGTPDSIDEDPGRVPTTTPTITPNPTSQRPFVRFSNRSFTVDERQDTAIITVILDRAPDSLVTVDYVTRDNTANSQTDYLRVSGTLVFDPNQTSQRFTVPILNDNLDEGDERITLVLENAQGATPGFDSEATLIILDDDEDEDNGGDTDDEEEGPIFIRFSQERRGFLGLGRPNYPVPEEEGEAIVQVVLSRPAPETIRVDIRTTNEGTATEGNDYNENSDTLEFLPNQTQQSFAFTLRNDQDPEGDETVFVRLSNAVGAGAVIRNPLAEVIIIDNDP